MDPRELSLFYQTTLEAAEEVRSLLDQGSLSRLLTILGRAGLRLDIVGVSTSLKAEEFLGRLDPAATPAWNHEAYMAERVPLVVPGPGGEPIDVRLPDHVCPHCGNSRSNFIQAARRHCEACGGSW